MVLTFENINDLQLYILELIKESGDSVISRKQKTLEVTSIFLRLNNIRKRCTTLIKRNWNLPFAIGELFWHLSGSNKVSFIEYYAKEWKNVSEDGLHIYGSCYGHKIFNSDSGESQWDKLIKLFKKDLFTRRGVLNLYDSQDVLDFEAKDIACSCTIQFLCRKGKLDAVIYMRSNDIIWGLPNDIFFFTMLQELLAKELNVEAGIYNHFVGSLHLYERHFKMADEILAKKKYIDFQMPIMNDIKPLLNLINIENEIRIGTLTSFDELENKDLSIYWKQMLEVLLIFEKNKAKVNTQLPLNIALENPYLFMIENLLFKKSIQNNNYF